MKANGWAKGCTIVAVVLVLVITGTPVVAQDTEEELPPEGAVPEVKIEEILASEDEMLAGEGFSYDPGNRRDPFKSLLAARDRPQFRGPRPEGIPGLLIEEIDLTGIFVMSDGTAAQVQSADQDRSFLIRVGDQLYDGDVVSISSKEIKFKQIVGDPTALKPFREVVKKLEP